MTILHEDDLSHPIPKIRQTRPSDDHIEVICAPSAREASREFIAPALHRTMSGALTLVAEGQLSEAVVMALGSVEELIRRLTGSEESGLALMETAFAASSPRLDVTTATGEAAEQEREGFRLLFTGAILGLRGPQGSGSAVTATAEETLEYLAVASMLMRRLDRAERRLD